MQTHADFLIVEDELLIAEGIAALLGGAGYERVRIVESVEEAVKEIENRPPTIVLSDIALGKEKTGIDLGEMLQNKYHIPFIYVSSHSSPEILGKAKHTRPNAYLVKPFKNEDLLVAVELALFNISNGPSNKTSAELTIKEGRVIVKLYCNDILWIEADGNYAMIYVMNGKRRLVRMSITELESQLTPDLFLRTHKSYLVNREHVTEIRSGSLLVKGQEIPIGRAFHTNVAASFKK